MLAITVMLGVTFTILQLMEYKQAPFSIRDSVFGSRFFIATGFHGLHVIIGTTFLLVVLITNIRGKINYHHSVRFECRA
jgi:cytochrome c oxidase subunit 3